MPATLTISILVCSALCGWCIAALLINSFFFPLQKKKFAGISFHGSVPANQYIFAEKLAAGVSSNLLTTENLQRFLASHNIMDKLRPEIEKHVDIFLKEKISEAFPLLYKFMGDKTLAKFKEAFLTEVEVLFPELLNSYAGTLLNELEPEKLIREKLNKIPVETIAREFNQIAGNQIKKFKLAGAALGLIAGGVQVLLILTLNK